MSIARTTSSTTTRRGDDMGGECDAPSRTPSSVQPDASQQQVGLDHAVPRAYDPPRVGCSGLAFHCGKEFRPMVRTELVGAGVLLVILSFGSVALAQSDCSKIVPASP